MRFTRSRIVIAAAAAAALIGAGLVVRAGFAAEERAPTQTFAGSFTSQTQLGVRNLTIVGGHIRVAYELDVLFEPARESTTLRCGLIDTSGRLDFFEGSRTNAPGGTWTHLVFSSDYVLPELTLGIRCSPSADGVMSAVFRNVTLTTSVIE